MPAEKIRSPFRNALVDKSDYSPAPGVYDRHTAPTVSKPGVDKELKEKFFDEAPSLKPGKKNPVRSPMGEMKRR